MNVGISVTKYNDSQYHGLKYPASVQACPVTSISKVMHTVIRGAFTYANTGY